MVGQEDHSWTEAVLQGIFKGEERHVEWPTGKQAGGGEVVGGPYCPEQILFQESHISCVKECLALTFRFSSEGVDDGIRRSENKRRFAVFPAHQSPVPVFLPQSFGKHLWSCPTAQVVLDSFASLTQAKVI